jgi:serine/threonine protein kinase
VKLLDFGVARIGEGDQPSLTETGIPFGTAAYMPPEVCAGERASTRSDIYSLGAVLRVTSVSRRSARRASGACASSTRRSRRSRTLGEWTREEARLCWTGARSTVALHVRGAA